MFARSIRFAVLATTLALPLCGYAVDRGTFPVPTQDVAKAPGKLQVAVFAGGCFWGTQSVFERVKGVKKTVVGYAGGKASTATYDQVTTETTGHAESVEVTYDPAIITYGGPAAHLLLRRARPHTAQPPGPGTKAHPTAPPSSSTRRNSSASRRPTSHSSTRHTPSNRRSLPR